MAKRDAETIQAELAEWTGHRKALQDGLPVCEEKIAELTKELDACKAVGDGDFVREAVAKHGNTAGFLAARMLPRKGGPRE
jgi:hypothetical protein